MATIVKQKEDTVNRIEEIKTYVEIYETNPDAFSKDIDRHTEYKWLKILLTALEQAEARVADYKENYDTLHAEYEKQKARVKELEEEVRRLGDRDCQATIQLIFPNEHNPFNKIDLKVVDVGVADNIYVCRSKEVEELQAHLTTAREAFKKTITALLKVRKTLGGTADYVTLDKAKAMCFKIRASVEQALEKLTNRKEEEDGKRGQD